MSVEQIINNLEILVPSIGFTIVATVIIYNWSGIWKIRRTMKKRKSKNPMIVVEINGRRAK